MNAGDYSRQTATGNGSQTCAGNAPQEKKTLTEDEQLDFLDALRDFTGNEFTSRDLRNFAVAADWDKELARALREQGATYKAIAKAVGTSESSVRTDYDFAEMQRMLTRN